MSCGSGFNVLLGNNGQGKTNILEAISYLSLTKSFYAANDATALQLGQEFFEIEGTLVTDDGHKSDVRVVYSKATGEKQFTINRSKPETLASVIGMFPIVILSPENNAITFGAPVERRKFVDLLLSQISRVYFEDLLEYRRALKQRNRILLDLRFQRTEQADILEPWTIGLVNYGSRIIYRRQQFLSEFQTYVSRAYHDLVQNHEEPHLNYVSLPDVPDDCKLIEEQMQNAFEQRRGEELHRGITLVGPHRDEVKFSIDGISAQKYASQGQHKTLLVALKVAEFFYLKERRNEIPILLLDDVFSELDEHRSQHILDLVGGLGQTFVTSTSDAVFHGRIEWGNQHRKFWVENGTCRPC
jgi:DNA replication and repair protein RecF